MQPFIHPVLYALLLFSGILVMLELGRRFALRHVHAGVEAEKIPLGTIETAVFALFGLLIAFTFSGAATRFQEKRMLIVQEANAMRDAYRYVEMVPPQAQPGLRDLLRDYVDMRIEIYDRLPDMRAAAPLIERGRQLQAKIWTTAVSATRLPGVDPGGARMLLPAVAELFSATATRMISLQNHPPAIVYALLFALGLLCSLLAGYRMPTRWRRGWVHIISFALVTSSVVYISLDMEYPRVGIIRLDTADQVLKEVRAFMK